MSGTTGIDQAQFAIEDRGLRRQLAEGLTHAPQAVGVLGAAFRVEADITAVLDGLEPKAAHFGSCSQSSPLGGRTDADGWAPTNKVRTQRQSG